MFLKKQKNSAKDNEKKPSAGRNLKVFDDDIYLVSYPKSGNTWLRFLIANLLAENPEKVSLSCLERVVPDIYRNSNEALSLLPRPRILKSHESFDPRYRKVIYIVRDPRDVAVSYYHHLIKVDKIKEDHSITEWIEGFIVGKYHPQFGTWQENVGSWLGARRNDSGFLIIKYEHLLKDGFNDLQRLSSFLDLNVSSEKIERSILLSSADRMREIEVQENWQPNKGNMRTDKRFIRAARSGSWKDELPPECVEKLREAWGSLMENLGYSD